MRSSFRYLVAAAAMFALAACSDTATAPQTSGTRAFAPSSGPAFDYSGGHGNFDQSSDFTVTARGGSFSVNGVLAVNFPENSVCNPDRSTYGSSEWDKSCSTLRSGESIKVKARIHMTSSGYAVDFSPELRFSPSTQVTLSTDVFSDVITSNRNYFANNPSSLNFLAIYYAPTFGAAPQADYVSDKSLVTHVDLKTGKVWRRIKHFSGYVGSSGESCDPADGDRNCVFVDF